MNPAQTFNPIWSLAQPKKPLDFDAVIINIMSFIKCE